MAATSRPTLMDPLVFLRMLVNAGKAAPGPPVGPALGAKGVKAMECVARRTTGLSPETDQRSSFCKLFNAQTGKSPKLALWPDELTFWTAAHFEPGVPMRVNMDIAPDRTFTFSILAPPTSHLILRAIGVPKGAPRPSEVVGTLSLKHVYEIAKIKKTDVGMETVPLESVARSVVAQARNMGVSVVR